MIVVFIFYCYRMISPFKVIDAYNHVNVTVKFNFNIYLTNTILLCMPIKIKKPPAITGGSNDIQYRLFI